MKDIADGVKYGYSKFYNLTYQLALDIRKLGQESLKDGISAKKQIFILKVQRNMAGRGAIIDNVVPVDNTPDPSKVFRLNVQLKWEVARDPLYKGNNIDKPCGVEPGMSFANSVKTRLGVISLVPCAKGGSSIEEWEKGDKHYENMIKRVKVIVKVGGVGGEIKALLWHQGESDTSNLNDAENYNGRLEKFVQNVRTDLNMPSLPVLQVIIESADGPFKDEVIK
ncbi:Hypothetical predicted protein [Olea europaea subsp. europaea]|uniref:Sialate O-acetylesterase domain-containing protein n=1 Tax=Olea europaea subsp. europaea TaxID=158383 RepID=A0A8S0UJ91_OLEEU|nr:Hypothetical predicted protein [Olea europaea subsp. europaea]